MSLLNILNPILAFNSAKVIIKDLRNYIFYRKQISKIKEQGFFKDYAMRTDWLKRVYYVINLEPETLLATGELVDLERSRVYDSIAKVKNLFLNTNLLEIIEASSKRIKDDTYYAYLVWIQYRKNLVWRDIVNVIVWSFLLVKITQLVFWLSHNYESLWTSILSMLTSK